VPPGDGAGGAGVASRTQARQEAAGACESVTSRVPLFSMQPLHGACCGACCRCRAASSDAWLMQPPASGEHA
jgi:hypothetical protein